MGCAQWWPARTAMPCLSRVAPRQAGSHRGRTSTRLPSPARPDHSEPGKEAHFPDGVAEQLTLVAQWPDIGDFSASAASPRWFGLTCLVVISLLHDRYLFVA